MLDIRIALNAALRLAIPLMTDSDLARIGAVLDAYGAADGPTERGRLNRDFHLALYAPADRPRLLALIQDNFDNANRFARVQVSMATGTDRPHREHQNLFRACRDGDIDAGVGLLEAHIAYSQKALVAAAGRGGGGSADWVSPRRKGRAEHAEHHDGAGGGGTALAASWRGSRAVVLLAPNPTLAAVKARGHLECGVHTGIPGWSFPDDKGVWKGLDVDLCRSVAAAIFGDANKVKYTPTTVQQRWSVLASGQVDLLSRISTLTFKRDTELGFNFVQINYFEGQTFITRKSANIKEAKDLDGAAVCVAAGSTEERNATDWSRRAQPQDQHRQVREERAPSPPTIS
jgi:ABC-type amino acid transport substrate-binding protein